MFKNIFKKGLDVANSGIKLIDKVLPDTQSTRDLKGEIIKAEIQSDSKFLKNARPMVIYVGLLLVILEYFGVRSFIINMMYETDDMIKYSLDNSEKILEFFLVTWGSVATAFVISRGNEKKNRKMLK
tara:strand:- start:2316 stop:2696 length:381 start_codon:yes stop_codon:yes gene_type:complete